MKNTATMCCESPFNSVVQRPDAEKKTRRKRFSETGWRARLGGRAIFTFARTASIILDQTIKASALLFCAAIVIGVAFNRSGISAPSAINAGSDAVIVNDDGSNLRVTVRARSENHFTNFVVRNDEGTEFMELHVNKDQSFQYSLNGCTRFQVAAYTSKDGQFGVGIQNPGNNVRLTAKPDGSSVVEIIDIERSVIHRLCVTPRGRVFTESLGNSEVEEPATETPERSAAAEGPRAW